MRTLKLVVLASLVGLGVTLWLSRRHYTPSEKPVEPSFQRWAGPIKAATLSAENLPTNSNSNYGRWATAPAVCVDTLPLSSKEQSNHFCASLDNVSVAIGRQTKGTYATIIVQKDRPDPWLGLVTVVDSVLIEVRDVQQQRQWEKILEEERAHLYQPRDVALLPIPKGAE